jgi:hypothetical protein
VDPPFDAVEEQPVGDEVTLVFARLNGEMQGFNMTPADATAIGIALAQAGQEEST